jgi:polyhydroxyalkanoate synthase
VESGDNTRTPVSSKSASFEPRDEEEALDSASGADAVGIPSVGALLRAVLAPLAQPAALTGEVGRLSQEQLAILRGRSTLAPSPKDRRFSDRSWFLNPVYRRLAQSYLSVGGSLTRLVDQYERRGPTGTRSSAPASRFRP